MIIWKIIIFIRLLLKKECPERYKERFGFTDKQKQSDLDTIWIHAVSVGEMNSAEVLIRELSNKFFVLLTTTSMTSAKLAENFKFNNFVHQFNPIDNIFSVRKFLNHWSVKKAIFIESEFWPFTIYETSKTSNIYLINARFSEKSYKRWYFWKNIFFKKILNLYTEIYPSGNFSKSKFESFGISNIKGNINTKIFNKTEFTEKAQKQKNTISALNLATENKNVFSFISLHLSEVEVLMPLINKILISGENNQIFILPRKIDDSVLIKAAIQKNLLERFDNAQEIDIYNQKSNLELIKQFSKIIILDQMGIAPAVYDKSDIAFVCGSFISGIGGHNPLEGIFLYKKCYIGSFYEKNIDLTEELVRNNLLNIINPKDLVNLDFVNNLLIYNSSFSSEVNKFFQKKETEFDNFIQNITA